MKFGCCVAVRFFLTRAVDPYKVSVFYFCLQHKFGERFRPFFLLILMGAQKYSKDSAFWSVPVQKHLIYKVGCTSALIVLLMLTSYMWLFSAYAPNEAKIIKALIYIRCVLCACVPCLFLWKSDYSISRCRLAESRFRQCCKSSLPELWAIF